MLNDFAINLLRGANTTETPEAEQEGTLSPWLLLAFVATVVSISLLASKIKKCSGDARQAGDLAGGSDYLALSNQGSPAGSEGSLEGANFTSPHRFPRTRSQSAPPPGTSFAVRPFTASNQQTERQGLTYGTHN